MKPKSYANKHMTSPSKEAAATVVSALPTCTLLLAAPAKMVSLGAAVAAKPGIPPAPGRVEVPVGADSGLFVPANEMSTKGPLKKVTSQNGVEAEPRREISPVELGVCRCHLASGIDSYRSCRNSKHFHQLMIIMTNL